VHRFEMLEEALRGIGVFIRKYNGEWMLQRRGYTTSAEVRLQLTQRATGLLSNKPRAIH
jgi:hypothetical protein